jgi:hypothetical protein
MSVVLPVSDLSRQTKPEAPSASALMGSSSATNAAIRGGIQRGHETGDVDQSEMIGHERLHQRNF